MPTIYDVAKRARVSTYTVSSVLNGTAYVSPELTKRVRDAVRELDYTINDLARSLQTRKTRTIGMLIPDIASPFYAKVVRGAEDVLRKSGYSLILGNTYNSAEEQSRYLAVFRSKQVDGLLLFVSPGDDRDLRTLVEARKPLVFVGRTPRNLKADSVSADNVKGTEMAVEHLLSKGHRRVALITGQANLSTSADRVSGWRRALRRSGVGWRRNYIGEGDWTADSGYRTTLDLLRLGEPPDAVFASNFLMMTGVLRALREANLNCPRDVEVMSSDDSEWLDVFEPRISTVAQPSYQMGAKAAELLLKRIKAPKRKFEQVVLDPELMLRDR
jgi:LacI family transcriptional regulator